MKKYIILFILIFGVASFAQQNDFKYPKHHIGVSASSISGTGVSYKFRSENRFAFKITGFAYFTQTQEENQSYENSEFWYNIGSELQYDIFNPYKGRLFIFAGTSYRFSKDEYGYENINYNEDYRFSIGPGVGFEFYFWERLSVNGEIGFNYSFSEYTNSYNINYLNDNSTVKEIGFLFGGGVGISYCF